MRATTAFHRLCVMGFLRSSSYAICRTPLLPLLARELGAAPPMVGFVVGASTLTGVLVKLPAGAWSDLLGRRPLLILGAVVFATMPFAPGGRVAGGAGCGAVRARSSDCHFRSSGVREPVRSRSGTASRDLAEHACRRPGGGASARSRHRWVSDRPWALRPGFRHCRLRSSGHAVFAAAATSSASRCSAHVVARGIVEVGRQPQILITSLAQAAQFVLHGALNAFLPLFARDAIGLTASQLGWLFAFQTATTLATRPVMGILSDRIDRRGVIVVGLSLCGTRCGSSRRPPG